VIAVDTSALMAIVLDETEASACIAVLEAQDDILISAATIAEALIVAARRNVREEMENLIDGLGFNAVAVTPASARRIALAYAQWGKGVQPHGSQRTGSEANGCSRESSIPPWMRDSDSA
jgi:ribonuclease VapC